MRNNSMRCVLTLVAALMMLTGIRAARAGTTHSATSADFTVNTRDRLVVTPDEGLSKTFGEADPVLTYTFTGAVGGETPAFTGALSREGGANVGTYPITRGTLALQDNGDFKADNYVLIFTDNVTFAITPKEAILTIADIDPVTYNGAVHTPEPEVRAGGALLTKDVDYTLSYTANINAGTATVTATGLNYTGTADKDFTINKAIATVKPNAGQSKIVGKQDPVLTYTTTGVMAGETPAYNGALARAEGEAIGTYLINQGTLALKDNDAFLAANYTLTFTAGVTFAITAKNVSTLTIADIDPVTYNGAAHTPEPEVKDGDDVLEEGTDYMLSYTANTNAGTNTATVTVTGKGGYTGTQDKTFTINKATVTVTPDAGQSKIVGADDPASLTYTSASAVAVEIPAFTGTLARDGGEAVGTYPINRGTLALINNGTFLAANYILVLTEGVTFAITKDASTLTIADIDPVTYNGTAHTPEPEVKDGADVLQKGTDYTLAYADNTNAGDTTVTVTGKGTYGGTQDKTFTINKATVTITPDAGKSKVIGTGDPELTYTFVGAVDGETPLLMAC